MPSSLLSSFLVWGRRRSKLHQLCASHTLHSALASPSSSSSLTEEELTRCSIPFFGGVQRLMASIATADLCDAHMPQVATGDIRVLSPIFQAYGKRRSFSGPIATVKVFEDNVLVRQLLEEQGAGKILVVDGGGSLRCALFGGNLATLGQQNGWAGVIVNGCIRDVDEINSSEIGVRALSTHPLKSLKRGFGEKNVPIFIGGARVAPGEWCYADADGIIISKGNLAKL
eukprot:c19614_g1_i1 orf=270-953(-)